MTVDVSKLERIPCGPSAQKVAQRSYDLLFDLLDGLTPEQWQLPTGYYDWTVRDTVAHLHGMARAYASIRDRAEQEGRARALAREEGLSEAAALVAVQIREMADLPDGQVLTRLRLLAPRAVAGDVARRRWFGDQHVPQRPLGPATDDQRPIRPLEAYSNVSLARDVWVHRIEIAQACGRAPVWDEAADGALLEDLVVDWFEHVASPAELHLTGPTDLTVSNRPGGPTLRLDAWDLVRLASGREPLGPVPDDPLVRTRLDF
jgi:uncharacterized protein (TIGR03083 family)